MSTNYPTSLDSYTTKTDNVTTVLAAHVNDLQAAVVALETQVGAGASKPTTAATASTIVLRDSSANIAAAGVTTTTGIALPRSGTAASLFAIDSSGTGSAVTLANAAAAYIFGNANVFSGLILVSETASDKCTGLFLVGGGTCEVIGQTNALWANTNAASKNCVYIASNAMVIQNNRGGSRTYNIFSIRLNTSN